MDRHNYPIDYVVTVTDDRVRGLLRERTLKPGPPTPKTRQAGRRHGGWTLRIVLAEPLIVGGAGFLLGWLVSQRG